MNLTIGDRLYEVAEDGAIRKLCPSPIMDGAEEAAVREVVRLRRVWNVSMARFHVINYTEIPALNRDIREKVLDTPSGYFTVRQLQYIDGAAFGVHVGTAAGSGAGRWPDRRRHPLRRAETGNAPARQRHQAVPRVVENRHGK